MKKIRISLLVVIALLLAACNGKDDKTGSQGSVNDGEKPSESAQSIMELTKKKSGLIWLVGQSKKLRMCQKKRKSRF